LNDKKASAFLSQVTCLEEEKIQLGAERNAMARTLNGQKEDLTELGAKVGLFLFIC